MTVPCDDSDAPPSRTHVQREHAFQRVAVAFLKVVLLPPSWRTAICHENELTENARARAKARGVEPGVHDIYVCQAPGLSAWVELKWGKNAPSDAQEHVGAQLDACGIPRGFCWSIDNIAYTLHARGFRLHGNWRNLAAEYQQRALAAVARAENSAGKPRATSRTRASKAPAARIRAAHKAGAWKLPS